MSVPFGDERLLKRYWDKVSISESGCWEWTGARSSAGYGQLRVSGKALLAHRMMAEVAYGPGGKLYCMHKCDNPPCVNPEHLQWGTPKENIWDAIQKGRLKPGTHHGTITHCPRSHELTEENTYLTKNGTRTCRECYRSHWREWNSRRKESAYATDRIPRHGTTTEYAWGCRCDKCREAKRDEARRRRERKKAEGRL